MRRRERGELEKGATKEEGENRQRLSGDVMPARRRLRENSRSGRVGPQSSQLDLRAPILYAAQGRQQSLPPRGVV